MAESKLLMLKDWFESISKTLGPHDAAYVSYAIDYYSCYDEKLDIGKIFGEDVAKRIDPVLAAYYTQIDRINNKFVAGAGRKEKYDSDKLRELASQGKTAKQICEELGIEYSRSIYSNKGYKEGHEKWQKLKEAYGGQDPRSFF